MVTSQLPDRRLIAILRCIPANDAAKVSHAPVDCGITIIEAPLKSPDPNLSIANTIRQVGGRDKIEAGMVLTLRQATEVADAVWQFIVSLICDADAIRTAVSRGLASWPGVMTPTERFTALDAGASGVKLFPATVVGIGGLSAIRAVLPQETEVYVVGSAVLETFADWLQTGAAGFGLGTALNIRTCPLLKSSPAQQRLSRPMMPRSGLGTCDDSSFPRKSDVTKAPATIVVECGTSNFRAWLMDAAARPIDSVTCPEELLKLPGSDFPAALNRACGSCFDYWPALPVLMCGMVGSRQGWREAAHLKGDVGAGDLAGATLAIATRLWDVRIVSGLQSKSYDGSPDVMRGEETQFIGAVTMGAAKDSLVCMPGTHSKRVELSGGRIRSISTFLTGELFALLRNSSILTGLIETEGDVADAVRARGYQSGLQMGDAGGALAHKLFSIRAQTLTGTGSGATAEMLSGLLIGSEIATVHPKLVDREIVLIASDGIADRCHKALQQIGIDALVENGNEACRAGLSAIAREVPEWRVAA